MTVVRFIVVVVLVLVILSSTPHYHALIIVVQILQHRCPQQVEIGEFVEAVVGIVHGESVASFFVSLLVLVQRGTIESETVLQTLRAHMGRGGAQHNIIVGCVAGSGSGFLRQQQHPHR